ncbi:protein STRUBBELIG-RECEPTOR FAMILY 3-like isoform X2 [Macadamia integrifolia]|uniref:protein STRUBBELIG-RECEPTOR FAMILY 3-like isoform X2 n=1 Tax=Macadamia integrifolia TaxID=60698 RepID=UPI001C4F4D4D|nr:protein STRUBBELIG-RECEPTOR FAMILY 3-like isoform X2 [Macadamia integrifolia]
MAYLNRDIYACVFFGLAVIFISPFTGGYTDPRDVFGINSLYAALGYPSLPGWVPNGGDPCLEAWQGVLCVNSNITSIILNGANLGGVLCDNLDYFSSIITIDLSNNHIGGSIPSSLPITMQNFFLSANQFTGTIPTSLASLTQLSDMSLNNNLLTGEIPDAFQGLTGLMNLDLSANNLSEQLPPSMESLSSLTTLHLQNNQLLGTLVVLQDLPLRDLNIENNLFSGPIPEKLLSIPNFKKDGNPFNTSIGPSPPPSATSQTPLPSGAPPSKVPLEKQANGPSSLEESSPARGNKFWTTTRIVWISITGVLVFIIVLLGLVFFMASCCKEREEADVFAKRHKVGSYKGPKQRPTYNGSMAQPNNQTEKVSKEAIMRPKDEHEINIGRVTAVPRQNDSEIDTKRMGDDRKKREDNDIDLTGIDMILMPPPAPVEKVIVKPISPPKTSKGSIPTKNLDLPISVRSFTIGLLQQYTNSFSQENLIGGGMLGSVYRAELPDGKLLAVRKLDNAASNRQTDEEFLYLVSSISKLRHANVVELLGYCAEHGQRLLIYEYFSNETLHDALHSDDELTRKLSWNSRVRVALGGARALEYLHEVCQPRVVHHNFKSTNILLDDKLAARVSDCGLASLISSRSLSGHLLSAYGYAAPEFDSGNYTYQSDVYSFGVVMLELLTGRKSYDRSRPRGEQFLVRWAIPRLHDIDALSRMVDPALNGAYPAKSLSRFADIISLCVQSEPEFRPPMSEIVQNLLHMIQRESPSRTLNKD